MRILICHGYLLRGTGSNQYVQSLARALCGLGHNLVIACQEPDPSLDFVSLYMVEEAGSGTPGVAWQKETGFRGTCMVLKPFIGGLLPVYVMDSYQGFEVKEFTALDSGELDSYVESNRRSLDRLLDRFRPDAILVNHAVMLPAIVRPVAGDYGIPYSVCIHGSAIDFAVRRDSRYLEYGARGLAGSERIFVPSAHTADAVSEVFAGLVSGLEEKVKLVPPGVDTGLIQPAAGELTGSLRLLGERIEERTRGVIALGHGGRAGEEGPGDSFDEIRAQAQSINASHPDWLPEEGVLLKLAEVARARRPFLVFLGKLLETKGLQCVLPAWPMILKDHPGATLVVVGFGELRGLLEMMINALQAGDAALLRELCRFGNREYTRGEDAFGPVLGFLDRLEAAGELEGYLEMCSTLPVSGSVIFTGYLTIEEHSLILPHATALLAPSIAPEAFGLVVTEAMAAGVVPLAPVHTGLRTAMEPLASIMGESRGSVEISTGPGMVESIYSAAGYLLEQPREELMRLGDALREVVVSRFSWDSVADRIAGSFQDPQEP